MCSMIVTIVVNIVFAMFAIWSTNCLLVNRIARQPSPGCHRRRLSPAQPNSNIYARRVEWIGGRWMGKLGLT